MQIMTPKARADIHMNLPALRKLDSMLIVGGLSSRKIPKIRLNVCNNLYKLVALCNVYFENVLVASRKN